MSAVMGDYLPTIQEELDRKALDTLDWLVSSHERHIITGAEFKVGLDSLFSAVNGLVRNDFAEMIGEAYETAHVTALKETRLFINAEGRLVALRRVMGEANYLFCVDPQPSGKWGKVVERSFDGEKDPEAKAEMDVLRMIKNLSDMGYVEI